MADAATTPARKPRILLVGHCRPDAVMLRAALRPAAPDAEFESVNDRAALEAGLGGADLLLINRALDGDFGITDGVELIRSLTNRARQQASRAPEFRPALMLVSTYPEAQAQAVTAGAVPGFGKPDAYNPATRGLIAEALTRSRRR